MELFTILTDEGVVPSLVPIAQSGNKPTRDDIELGLIAAGHTDPMSRPTIFYVKDIAPSAKIYQVTWSISLQEYYYVVVKKAL